MGDPAMACDSWPGGFDYAVESLMPVPWSDFIAKHGHRWRHVLSAGSVPMLFSRSPAASWRAITDWNNGSTHWTQHHSSGVLHNCYSSSQQTFRYFDADRPLEPQMSAAKADAAWNQTRTAMSVSSLFASSSTEFHYCSADVEYLGERLQQDVSGLTAELSIDPLRSVGNVWLGDAGTSAHPHYDTEHNMFSVAVGRKIFHLWSPQQTKGLYLHPSHHAGGRQSQALFEARVAGWPAVSTSTAMQVELKPGETLYVPPFWMHRVHSSTSFTIGVNVWSESAAFRSLGLMQKIPLPLTAAVPRNGRVHLVVAFLNDIAAALQPELGSSPIAELVQSRYVEPLRTAILAHGTMLMGASLCVVPSLAEEGSKERQQQQRQRQQSSDRAAKVAALLRDVPGGAGVLAMILGDYVELVSAAAFGHLNVAAFLTTCYESTWV